MAVTAVLGTLTAIAHRAAAAGRGDAAAAPARYRRTLLERLGGRLPPALRMILRNMERRPLRAGAHRVGIALAVAIVIMGNFFRDAIEAIVDTQFNLGMRGDVDRLDAEPVDDARAPRAGAAARRDGRWSRGARGGALRPWPPQRARADRRLAPRAELQRVIDVRPAARRCASGRRPAADRPAGRQAGCESATRVRVEVLEGAARRAKSWSSAVRDMMGLNAFMERARSTGCWATATWPRLRPARVERGLRRACWRRAGDAAVAGALSKATMLRNMEEISARNVR